MLDFETEVVCAVIIIECCVLDLAKVMYIYICGTEVSPYSAKG